MIMTELILCGRGGQGIVFLTRQIGEIAAAKGMDVISSETHGMAVRGGSINSHVRIGAFSSPLIRPGHADFLLSLDPTETPNNRHFLKPRGIIIENSALPSESGIYRIDAAAIARSLGRVQLENVVLLGLASTLDEFPVTTQEARGHIEKEPRAKVREWNLKALTAGVEARTVRRPLGVNGSP
jgi:indolepyruvate ferredoxin oxidoreductase beta subunit